VANEGLICSAFGASIFGMDEKLLLLGFLSLWNPLC